MIDAKKISNILINLLLSAIFSFSLIYAITSSLMFNYKTYELISFGLILTFTWYIVFLNKLTTKLFSVAAVTLIVASCIYLASTEKIVKFILELSYFSTWIIDYSQGYESLNKAYQPYLTLLVCLTITLPVYFFSIRKFSFSILLIGGVSIFSIQWMYDIFISYFAFYSFVFTILIFYFIHVFHKKRAVSSDSFVDRAEFSFWMVPVGLVLVILCIVSPYRSKPIEFPWLDRKINSAYNYFTKTYKNYNTIEFFSISSTGFGENSSRLGGKVKLDKTLVMKVEAPKALYLRGASREIFNGTKWTNIEKTQTEIFDNVRIESNDLYELFSGMKLFAGERGVNNKYISSYDVKISYKSLVMKTLFTPAKTYIVDFPNNKTGKTFLDQNSVVTSKNVLSKTLEYKLKAYNLDMKNKEFINLLKKSKPGLYNEIKNKIDSDELKRLSQISSNAYSSYLQVPSKMPSRVKDLSKSITTSKKNTYDKVKAIEDYLSKNYTYTLTPKSTPRRKDFLDYFLFESKEGYCTYYASAMTVLVRCLGIPARYVEGYILPPSPKTGKTYEVTNEQAHAWVEVYFDGFGWIPFEPTAPFRTNFYDSKQDSEARFSQSMTSNPAYEEYLKRMQGYGNLNIATNFDFSEIDTERKLDKKTYYIIIVSGSVLILIFACLSIILYNTLKTRYRLNNIRKLDSRNSIIEMYGYYARVFAELGYPFEAGETPAEFSKRIDSYIIFYKSNSFKAITDKFLMARYSNNVLSESDKNMVLGFQESIVKEAKSSLGKIRFFLKKFILGKI